MASGHTSSARLIVDNVFATPILQRPIELGAGDTMVTFELIGGKEAAFMFLNALEIIDISNNLGDAKTLITHPATTTHQHLSQEDRAHLNISNSIVRLSVGLEDSENLLKDLNRALKMSQHN